MVRRIAMALTLGLFAANVPAADPATGVAADARGDWREFRGPGGVGVGAGKPLPTTWGPGKNVTWVTPIPGAGWSSPIAVGGNLYLTTAVPDNEAAPKSYSLRVIALDAAKGTVLWNDEAFVEPVATTPQPHKKNSHASPTPVSDGKKLWVHFGHMGTACYSFEGKALWRDAEHPYAPVHGNGASPILAEGNVVVPCDGKDEPYLLALNQETGKVAWQTPRKTNARLAFSFATCQHVTHNGESLIVSPASDYVMGYDAKTGAERFRVKYPQPGWSLIARPLYAHGLVYVCTGYVNQHVLAFKPEGRGDITPTITWQSRKGAPNTPTPLIYGDELYLLSDSGLLTCLDAKTGKEHYSERLASRGYSASPIVNAGKLFVTSEDGVGQVIALGKAFEVLEKNPMGERTFATFVPKDGALFVRTEAKLYRFDGAGK